MAAKSDIFLSASLDGLPNEILLDILSEIDYDPSLEINLRLVSKRFKQITDGYQHCIASNILNTQFAWAPRQYPELFEKRRRDGKPPGWKELAAIFHRTAVLSNIKSRCKIMREGNSEHSAWTTCRALTFQHVGLLLLYRLSDTGSAEAKAELLNSLPKGSLAILLFTLMVSVHLLRAVGPQMVLYWTDPPVTEEIRSDIELACEELLLRDGPRFLLGLLMHDNAAIESLKTEVFQMDSRQTHNDDGAPPPPTLIATLRQAFSTAVKCEIRYSLVHMWYVLDEECAELADSDEKVVQTAIERIVNGEPLERRCGRCRLMQMYGL
ncbi:hypothetical protein CAC42_7748 [Sphaceloma murrayae]|uniref:F-box domain-containing protein n=1 Tax=Sphaceloma murrayae TaxID=2082308 RepID=A0A2K1QXK3_9PEZI|nr:hypothetical protein CAC42_7748 [Sphaceloma murrayae]